MYSLINRTRVVFLFVMHWLDFVERLYLKTSRGFIIFPYFIYYITSWMSVSYGWKRITFTLFLFWNLLAKDLKNATYSTLLCSAGVRLLRTLSSPGLILSYSAWESNLLRIIETSFSISLYFTTRLETILAIYRIPYILSPTFLWEITTTNFTLMQLFKNVWMLVEFEISTSHPAESSNPGLSHI